MKSRLFLMMLAVVIGIWGRLIPHWPNFTPTLSLMVLVGAWFSFPISLLVMIATVAISDLILSFLLHYPFMGGWSIFVYSGYIFILVLGSKLSNKLRIFPLLGATTAAALLFWVWTNFGTWLVAGLYPKNMMGLLACYSAALPFLYASLLSGILWSGILWICDQLFQRKKELSFSNITATMFRR